MIPVPYIKIHTNKNDFIFIPLSLVKTVKNIVPEITSMHQGISADGVVFYERDSNEFIMKYFNKDGSHSSICGNSLIATGGLYEFIKHDRTELFIRTEEGKRKVKPVKKDMWGALVSPLSERIKKMQVVVEGRVYKGFYTEVPGNPHFIIENKPEEALFSFLAPKIAKHRDFPSGTNVEFIYEENGKLFVRVYERGVGETESCATGASAIYLLYKFVKFKELKDIYFKGGKYLFYEEDNFVGLIAKPQIVSRGIIFV